MLRLDPTSNGGFLLYNDYAADIGTSSMGIVVCIVYFLAVLNPFFNNPHAFYDAFAALFIGLAVIFFITNIEGLSFLAPLALPFLTYSVASTGVSMAENVTPTIGLLMIVAIPALMLVANVGIFLLIGIENYDTGFLMIPAIFNFLVMSYASLMSESTNALFYLMRVMVILSIGMIIFNLFKSKLKINAESIIANISILGIGILAFIILAILASTITYSGSLYINLFLVIATILTYALVTLFSFKFIQRRHPKMKGSFEGLLFGIFFSFAFLFATTAYPAFRNEFVSLILSIFRNFPFASFIANGIEIITSSFAYISGVLVTLVFNLVLMIFDSSLPNFILPFPIAIIILLITLSFTISLTSRLINKKAK